MAARVSPPSTTFVCLLAITLVLLIEEWRAVAQQTASRSEHPGTRRTASRLNEISSHGLKTGLASAGAAQGLPLTPRRPLHCVGSPLSPESQQLRRAAASPWLRLASDSSAEWPADLATGASIVGEWLACGWPGPRGKRNRNRPARRPRRKLPARADRQNSGRVVW